MFYNAKGFLRHYLIRI